IRSGRIGIGGEKLVYLFFSNRKISHGQRRRGVIAPIAYRKRLRIGNSLPPFFSLLVLAYSRKKTSFYAPNLRFIEPDPECVLKFPVGVLPILLVDKLICLASKSTRLPRLDHVRNRVTHRQRNQPDNNQCS